MVLAASAAPSVAAIRFIISIMGMVLTRVRDWQNSASVLGPAECRKAATTLGGPVGARSPGFRMCGPEERCVARASPAQFRAAFVSRNHRHPKCRRVVIVEGDGFDCRHGRFFRLREVVVRAAVTRNSTSGLGGFPSLYLPEGKGESAQEFGHN